MSTVLVVDDDPAIRRLIRTVLLSDGHTVEEASDGREALEAIRRSCPDVLILDLMMPRIDGTEVFKRLEKIAARPPTMILSAYAGAGVRRELHPEAFMPKPFDPQQLSDVVTRLSAP